MSRAVETIMELTGCSEDDAQRVYAETNNVDEAVDKLLPHGKVIIPKKPLRTYTAEELEFKKLRSEMKKLDAEHDKRSILTNQREHAEQVEHCNLPIATELQSNYYQECQLPSLQSEAQKLETVCPSPSECSSGLPSNGQT